MTKSVLILGPSGKVGSHSREAFSNAGWDLRTFNRHKENMIEASQGVDVILNGLNPPSYHNWKEIIPQITAQVIEAAKASGATVIIPGNVYHYGDKGGVWSERTEPNPVTRKGRIRLQMERDYQRSGVQTIVLRAGDFIDPNRNACVMSSIYLRNIQKYQITLPSAATIRRANCYLPDWARAAVGLAEIREELGTFEDIPFSGHTLSAEDIRRSLEKTLDRKIEFAKFPWWAIRLLSPVWEMARELHEMRYLYDTDHSLDGSRLSALLPNFSDTDIEIVLRSVLPASMKESMT